MARANVKSSTRKKAKRFMKVNPSSFDSEDRNFRIAQKRAFTILKRRRDVMITELATQFPHKPVTFWVEEVDNAIKTIKLGLRIK